MAKRRAAAVGFARLKSSLALMAQAATPEVTVSLSNLSALKLRWLAGGGRDFERPTGDLLRAMGAAYAAELVKLAKGRGRKDARRPWLAAAEVFRDAVASRLATSGGDLRSKMTKLAPATVDKKGHARIGVDSGQLLKDVATADITVKLKAP